MKGRRTCVLVLMSIQCLKGLCRWVGGSLTSLTQADLPHARGKIYQLWLFPFPQQFVRIRRPPTPSPLPSSRDYGLGASNGRGKLPDLHPSRTQGREVRILPCISKNVCKHLLLKRFTMNNVRNSQIFYIYIPFVANKKIVLKERTIGNYFQLLIFPPEPRLLLCKNIFCMSLILILFIKCCTLNKGPRWLIATRCFTVIGALKSTLLNYFAGTL